MGAILVLLLFGLGASGIAPRVVELLLSPGLLLAGLVGYGAHDLETIALAILGDSMFYGILCLLISFLRLALHAPNRQ